MHRLSQAALSAFALFATLCSAACAPVARQSYASRPVSADVITQSEISQQPMQTAYSALAQLRPLFLRSRPNSADARGEPRRIQIYIDGVFSGDLDVLKLIPASDVESITRVQPEMAFATMGSEHAGDGVLMVRLLCHGVC